MMGRLLDQLAMTDRRTTAEDARYRVLAPAAVGEVIDALEALSRLKHYDAHGILRGRSAQQEQSLLPHGLRDRLDTVQGAVVVKLTGLAGAVIVLTGRNSRRQQITGTALMFAAHWFGEVRNPFGRDGSDQMSGLIAGYRLLTAAVPDPAASDDLFLRAVNAQTAVSYAASGFAKAISSTWRSGDALDQVLRTKLYGASVPAEIIRSSPALGKALTWFTIAWESGYPLVYLLGPVPARRALLGVKLFHLGIAATMGLPRFFWGFSSAHAAVEYVIDTARRPS